MIIVFVGSKDYYSHFLDLVDDLADKGRLRAQLPYSELPLDDYADVGLICKCAILQCRQRLLAKVYETVQDSYILRRGHNFQSTKRGKIQMPFQLTPRRKPIQ